MSPSLSMGPWERIRRHKVAQWTLAYAAGAYTLLHTIIMMSDALGWSHLVVRIVTLLLLLGLPLAVTLAWFHGYRAQQRISGSELAILTALLVLAAGVLWVLERPTTIPATNDIPVAATATPIDTSIAVMPFGNLSPDPNDAYFADGVHEELLSRLAALHGVRVISRTSVMAYRELNKSAKEIGRELDVTHVLEGSVRRAGGRFLLTAQLIDAREDSHLWTESYEGEITEVFAAQRDVAKQIVGQLKLKLTEAEESAVSRVPTKDAEAYALFQRGREVLQISRSGGVTVDVVLKARPFFEAAIARDPDFAQAHAWLSIALSNVVWGAPPADELHAPAIAHARRALDLAPDLSDAHLARGYALYFVNRDYMAAEASFHRALELAPNSLEAHLALAYITRRQGRSAEAASWFEAATRINPRDIGLMAMISSNLVINGRFQEALTTLDKALVLAPDDIELAHSRAVVIFRAFGDSGPLRALHEKHPERLVESADWFRYRVMDLLSQDRVADAVKLIERERKVLGDTLLYPVPYQVALKVLRRATGKPEGESLEGFVAAQRKAYFDQVRPRRTGGRSLTVTLAFTGHIDEAADVLDLEEEDLDSFGDRSTDQRRPVAALRVVISALRGESDAAIDQLRSMMADPGWLTVQDLRAAKYYFPTLRDDPRFQALLRGG